MDELADDPDRLGRALDRLKTVEGNAEDEELGQIVGPHLPPVGAHGVVPVHDGAPGGSDEEDREDDGEGLNPVGEGGIDEVVGPRPEVGEDEGPEGYDRESVAEDGQTRRLRQKVVEHGEDGRTEDKADDVVSVPPLDVGAVDAGEDAVRLEEARRHRQVVDDVKDGDGDNGGDDIPERDVHLLFPAFDNGAEDVDGEDDPEDDDAHVEGPLQLGVLQGLVHPGEEAQRRQGDGAVEEVEVKTGEFSGRPGAGA